jgi:hypothetical protein
MCSLEFSIQPDGVCRLNPDLARRVAQLAQEQVGLLRLKRLDRVDVRRTTGRHVARERSRDENDSDRS